MPPMRDVGGWRTVAISVALGPLVTGCAHESGELLGAGLVAGAAVAGAALTRPDPDPVVYDRVVIVHDPPVPAPSGPPPDPPPGPPPDDVGAPSAWPPRGAEGAAAPAPPPRRAPFDPELARALLEQVDVPGCRFQGAPRGPLHAAVVFSPSGSTSRIVIAAPTGLTSAALACIGERVGKVRVPPFLSGDEHLIDVSWLVP